MPITLDAKTDPGIDPRFSLELYGGGYFSLNKPAASRLDILDIAHGLALECRFGGQCRVPYSVAEHSSLVATEFRKRFPDAPRAAERLALLHDGHEFVAKDLPKPLKLYLRKFTDAYDRLCARLDIEIFAEFQISSHVFEACHDKIMACDAIVCRAEAQWLLPSRGKAWQWDPGTHDFDHIDIRGHDWRGAEMMFLEHWERVKPDFKR